MHEEKESVGPANPRSFYFQRTNDKPTLCQFSFASSPHRFYGCRQTSVGQVVAKKLRREFVDMDAVIEQDEGMAISKIFETRGESYFRARESDVCARLATRENLVVATGGGALVNPQNRAQFRDAFIVCLDAAADEIYNRLKEQTHRPLLSSPNTEQRIVELLSARREAYAHIEWHVDTTGKTVDQIADEIVELLERNGT